MRGTIKWYCETKRFGWIASETGEEVYLHFSSLRWKDGDRPREGEVVVFDVLQGPRGKQAIRVRRPDGNHNP